MSTTSAPTSRLLLPSATTSLTARGLMRVIAVSALVAAAGAGVLVATSNHLVHPVAYGMEIAVIVVTTAGAALVWAVSRPGNRIAVVLLAYAAAVAGVSLQGAASPLLYSLGVLFDLPALLLGYYLIFIFPTGRLSAALEKVLLIGAVGILLTSFVPWFFFSPVVAGGAPLATCNASCPENALMISDRPGIASGFGETELYLTVLWAAAVTAGLLYRLASASRPRQRALLPVYVPALLLTIPFGVFAAVRTGLIDLSAESVDTVGWFATAGRTFFSVGFLLAILQAMIFAGVALRTILSRAGQEQDTARLRDLLAGVLDDPRLELAFRVDRPESPFVDSRGDPIDVARAATGRSATGIGRRGEMVAYIVHDPGLDTDPELLQAAGHAVLLTLEGSRLESELRTTNDELQASRGRIVASAERERRRLERDLHDGAQQRLMAIQVKLAMAEERAAAVVDLSEQLEEIRVDAAEAVEELRTLAHGIYPTVLRERGLADSLRSVAMTAPITIDVTDEGLDRCPPAIETTIYFCSLEAIQNAIKHAGSGAHVTVTLARQTGRICFEVADDGVGMDAQDSHAGMGLLSMRDRVGAVGGQLEIVSSPGQGTTVRGVIPEAPDDSPVRAGELAP